LIGQSVRYNDTNDIHTRSFSIASLIPAYSINGRNEPAMRKVTYYTLKTRDEIGLSRKG
jgi:hypothetical protein